jgi:uncharacterized membrane protein YphA (DoxX/SURF4 family)
MQFLKKYGHYLLSFFVAFVFIQSLFFKFTDSPETKYIFEEKLEPWAQSLGAHGLFAPGGIFSAHVVGSFELIASVLIVMGTLFMSLRLLQALGAGLGLCVISGAIFFHLFTPLGTSVRNADGTYDGGQLFMLACAVWLSCLILLWIRRELLQQLLQKLLHRQHRS